MRRKRGGRSNKKKGSFDPTSSTVKKTKLGIWDLYEEVDTHNSKIGSLRTLVESHLESLNALPYVWRMLKDIASIRRCWPLWAMRLIIQAASDLLPAVALWYSGKMLDIIQIAIDERRVDTELLTQVALGRIACSMGTRFLGMASVWLSIPTTALVRQYYATHTFQTLARLDVPTFEDPIVNSQIQQSTSHSSRSSVAMELIELTLFIWSTLVQFVTQFFVVIAIVKDKPDGPLLATLSFLHCFVQWYSNRPYMGMNSTVWAATTTNTDYIKMRGLSRIIWGAQYRKEIVAGGMAQYLVKVFKESTDRLGSAAQDFYQAWSDRNRTDLHWGPFFQDPLAELPQIVFTFRAVHHPGSIPLSLASLNIVNQAVKDFSMKLFALFSRTSSFAARLDSLRQIYETAQIPNAVADGHLPYPEETASISSGISIEFRNVSFQYPRTEAKALDNVSFRIAAGQLCVIVGENGSGKSTILKLIARIYDPTEGSILVDNKDIKTLKLDDLRRATAVLFQDYTLFPLSIKDNIGIGDPAHAENIDHIERAAKFGGTDEFIRKLPEGYDTYLDRPVQDYYSTLPEGTTTLFGRDISYVGVTGMFGSKGPTNVSGGQMQRIALSRTFMRSIVSEDQVGLLLFDEPSASLDPTAEHDLFERLRMLRGNKTMVFSSHRFGNLTRHADLILYMHQSHIIEMGTHNNLTKAEGEYARIWNLQAQQFL